MRLFLPFLLLISAQATASCEAESVLTTESLTVVTLNVAHGRGLGMNQMLQSGKRARENLARVAELLGHLDADVVALQEADGPSKWSGGFDHVEVLAEAAGYPCRVHGEHAVSRLYSFGTAVLSRFAYEDTQTHGFQPSPPTTNKGFTRAAILWNPGNRLDEPLRVNLVSVHLDFSRESVRESQVAEMGDAMEGETRPAIILGDFNTGWTDDDSALRRIAQRGRYKTWAPFDEGLGTYKDGKKRLDWILVSHELDIVRYEVIEQDVSDHRAVIAEIRLPGTEQVQ